MAAIHHTITPIMVAGIWTGSDHGPLRLEFLAANPMCVQCEILRPIYLPLGEVWANINALTMIPHHLLHPVGDTSSLHIGY